MPIKAVVFDLWGTLVPIDPTVWRGVYEETARLLGASREELERAWGRTSDERMSIDMRVYLERVCDELGLRPSPEKIERALELRRAAHEAGFVARPDAEETLRRLRTRGYLTGLITNCTSEVPELWRRSPLSGLVDAEVFSCREGLLKPDPRIYLLATSRLGIDPGECLFVGDGASNELAGAKAVGMEAVLLRSSDATPPPGWSGLSASSLSEVLELVGESPAAQVRPIDR
jgi:putative hydrolase of the HAD superfamily